MNAAGVLRTLPALAASPLLLCSLLGAAAQAQVDASANSEPKGQRIFVSIGISKYDACLKKPCWPALPTSVNDTTDMKKLLVGDFDFVAPDDLQLTDEQATKAAIEDLIEDKLHSYVKPNDDLVIMYSGHGTRSDEPITGGDGATVTLTRGFIVPWGARRSDPQHTTDFIDTTSLLTALASLRARHILVILDSCNSGLALTGAIGLPKGDTPESDMDRKIGRNLIAATQPDEEAASSSKDDLNHSLFTGLLLKELRPGSKYGQHGFISGRDLGEYAKEELEHEAHSPQRPLTGTFFADGEGDVLFHFKISVPAVTKAALADASSGELALFKEDVAPMIASFPTAPQSLWAKYRLDIRTGDIGDAMKMLDALSTDDDADGTPISQEEAGHLVSRMGTFRPLMSFPKEDTTLKFAVMTGKGDSDAGTAQTGESDSESEMMYEMPIRTDWLIQVTNTSKQTLRVSCLAMDPRGDFVSDLCRREILPGKTYFPMEREVKPEVIEFHFYARPVPTGNEVGQSAQKDGPTGVQTSIRVQFLQQPVKSASIAP
jgi:hypothetical protein